MKKIGIVNSGGDTQAINAVIASAVKYGVGKDFKFIGFIKGWEGILDMDYMELGVEQIRGISHLGGTILHSVTFFSLSTASPIETVFIFPPT